MTFSFKAKTECFLLFLAALILALFLPLQGFATSKDTEAKLNQAKEQAGKTQSAVNAQQGELNSLHATENSLRGDLASLDEELTTIGERLEELAQQIEDKNAEIDATEQELWAAEDVAHDQYAAMKRRVQYMYEKREDNLFVMLLESSSLSEFLNIRDYVMGISRYDRRKLEEYRQVMAEIAAVKARLEEERAELDSLVEEAEEEKAKVNVAIKETAETLNIHLGEIEEAEAYAAKLKEMLDAQKQEISNLEKQLAEERRLEALSRASVWRNISDVTFEEGDRYLLANLIYCEAGNQPYEGQVAVGAVVINRLLSGAFPNTIVGVIYQRNQFEPAGSGRLALALARDDATPACYAAADAAMAGQSTVDDCIFFRTPIPQVTPRYVIGGHIFY